MNRMQTRRRVIGITAAGAGLALLPLPYRAGRPPAGGPLRSWRGVALGAYAVLQIHHPDAGLADLLIERAVAEVRRLEGIFSLYRPDSTIARLNRQGFLADPPTDLVRLLGESQRFARLTGGAFDPTVQPLWRLYATHFERPGADPEGPSAADRAAAVALVGYDQLEIEAQRIRLTRPGMGLTLNGVAQGYITDRVAELLLESGVEQALVDLGEIRGLGSRPTGEAWRIGLEDPRAPGRVAETIQLRNSAIATSAAGGTRLDRAGRFTHILDPSSGQAGSRYLSVSVAAPQAATADALSTAFYLMPLQRTAEIARDLGLWAHFTLADGSRVVQSA